MIRVTFSIILFTLISTGLKAQFQDLNLGVVPLEQVKSTSYSKDPDAEAVILHDAATAKVVPSHNELNMHYTEKRRIKILEKSGLERATITIPFYQEAGSKEKITGIRAYSHTFTEDRGVVIEQLSSTKIFTEQVDKNWSQIKFAIPGAAVNSVIEYEFTKISPFIAMPDWDFQASIPVEYSEYKVFISPFYTFQFILQGASKFDEYESYTEKRKTSFGGVTYSNIIYRMALKDLKAFKDESYITSISDYITKIDWQLSEINRLDGRKIKYMTTWPELIKTMSENESFGKYIKSAGKQAKGIFKSGLNTSGMPPMQTAQAIERYVKENFAWNRTYTKYSQQSSKELMKTREGFSADINLFLVGMYRAAGLEAYPVILSTRGHGKVKLKYPFSSFFNTVAAMVVVDGKRYLTDGTEPNLKFAKLPPNYLNEVGLVIDPKKEEWIDLSSTAPSTKAIQMTSTLDLDEQSLKTYFTFQLTDYDAIRYRRNSELFTEQINESYELEGEVKSINAESYKKPLLFSYEARLPLDFFEGKYYLTPFFNEAHTSNPIQGGTRDYPIDFNYSYTRDYRSEFLIPEGYKVTTKPEDLSFTNPVMDFDYTILEEGNKVVVTGKYTLKKAVYSPKEFNRVKFFFGKLADKFKEQIVVEKVQ